MFACVQVHMWGGCQRITLGVIPWERPLNPFEIVSISLEITNWIRLTAQKAHSWDHVSKSQFWHFYVVQGMGLGSSSKQDNALPMQLSPQPFLQDLKRRQSWRSHQLSLENFAQWSKPAQVSMVSLFCRLWKRLTEAGRRAEVIKGEWAGGWWPK